VVDSTVVKTPTIERIASTGPTRDAVRRRDVRTDSAASRPATGSAQRSGSAISRSSGGRYTGPSSVAATASAIVPNSASGVAASEPAPGASATITAPVTSASTPVTPRPAVIVRASRSASRSASVGRTRAALLDAANIPSTAISRPLPAANTSGQSSGPGRSATGDRPVPSSASTATGADTAASAHPTSAAGTATASDSPSTIRRTCGPPAPTRRSSPMSRRRRAMPNAHVPAMTNTVTNADTTPAIASTLCTPPMSTSPPDRVRAVPVPSVSVTDGPPPDAGTAQVAASAEADTPISATPSASATNVPANRAQ
jgi:hypothetical protein